jgi:hypothetical protein
MHSSRALNIFDTLYRLKTDPKSSFHELFKDLTLVKSQPEKIPILLQNMEKGANDEVFVFARTSEKGTFARVCEEKALPAIDSKSRPVYIDESQFPIGAYYPLMEIVTISLVAAHKRYTAKEVKSILIKQFNATLDQLNLADISDSAPDAFFVFMLLPSAATLSTGELMKQYALRQDHIESKA